jgi:hypothetical protein
VGDDVGFCYRRCRCSGGCWGWDCGVGRGRRAWGERGDGGVKVHYTTLPYTTSTTTIPPRTSTARPRPSNSAYPPTYLTNLPAPKPTPPPDTPPRPRSENNSRPPARTPRPDLHVPLHLAAAHRDRTRVLECRASPPPASPATSTTTHTLASRPGSGRQRVRGRGGGCVFPHERVRRLPRAGV